MLSPRQHVRVSTPSIPGGCDAPGPRSASASPLTGPGSRDGPTGEGEVHFSCVATQLGGFGGSQKDLDGDAAKGRCSACVWPLARSNRELGSSAAAVGQQQQAPQTQPRERIAPQQRWRAAEHRLHAVPPQATLPSGLLVFETFDFLRGIGFAVNSRSVNGVYSLSKSVVGIKISFTRVTWNTTSQKFESNF